MPDTGKMERLFHQCTSSIMFGGKEQMIYPEGDLDGIAEQLSLCIDMAEERVIEAHKLADAAEARTAYVVGEARRAHKSLEGALKGAAPVVDPLTSPDDEDFDDEDEDEAPYTSLHGKKKGKKRRPPKRPL